MPTGCFPPLLETLCRGISPLWTPLVFAPQNAIRPPLRPARFGAKNTKIPQTSSYDGDEICEIFADAHTHTMSIQNTSGVQLLLNTSEVLYPMELYRDWERIRRCRAKHEQQTAGLLFCIHQLRIQKNVEKTA